MPVVGLLTLTSQVPRHAGATPKCLVCDKDSIFRLALILAVVALGPGLAHDRLDGLWNFRRIVETPVAY